METARNAAWDALASLGAEVNEEGNQLRAVTGWSLFSFGEHVEVELTQQDEEVLVTVRSRQKRGQTLDVSRRNHKNVGSVLSRMSLRLS